MKSQSIYYLEAENPEPAFVSLQRPLIVGRWFDEQSAEAALERDGRPDLAFVLTENQEVTRLDRTQYQISIQPHGSTHRITNGNPSGDGSKINGEEFTVADLSINDRISLGDEFHFHFDGTGLYRVPEKQGGRIVARELSKQYPRQLFSMGTAGKVALQQASITVEPNQFVGVIGPSGGGKSTLLKLLSGATKPTSGWVAIDGIDVHAYPRITSAMVGLVPQDDIVHPELTVLDAVFCSACLRLPSHIGRQAKLAHVERVLEQFQLEEFRHSRIRELSGGQRKRVSIAIEILRKSKVLFLDEPSSGLDPNKEEILMIQLRELADQGWTIVCTTHVLYRDFLFHKICVVAKGTVVYYGPTASAPAYFGKETLLELYQVLDDPAFQPVPWVDPEDAHLPEPAGVANAGPSYALLYVAVCSVLLLFSWLAWLQLSS